MTSRAILLFIVAGISGCVGETAAKEPPTDIDETLPASNENPSPAASSNVEIRRIDIIRVPPQPPPGG